MFFVVCLFGTPNAFAVLSSGSTVVDPANTAVGSISAGSDTTSATTDVIDKVGKMVLAPVLQSLMNQVMDKMNNSIINWVNTGFDGNPFYIEDPKQFSLNLALDGATDVAGRYRTEMNEAVECDNRRRMLLQENPDADVPPCDTTLRGTNTNRAILLALGDTSFKSTADAIGATQKSKETFDDIANKSNQRRAERQENRQTNRQNRGNANASQNQATSDIAIKGIISNIDEDAMTFSIAGFTALYADAVPRFDILDGAYLQVKSQEPIALGTIVASDLAQKRLRNSNVDGVEIEITDTIDNFNTTTKSFTIAGIPASYQPITPAFTLQDGATVTVTSDGPVAQGARMLVRSIEERPGFQFDSDEFRDEAADVFGVDRETGRATGASVLEQFKGDFAAAGNQGYEALLLDPNLTAIGAYESAKSAIASTVAQNTEALTQEGQPLSQRKCKEPKSQYTREIKDSSGRILKTICLQYQVETPSQVITSQLDSALGSQFDKLIQSSDNPYAQLATAGLQQLVTGVMNAGFNKLTQLSVSAVRDAFSDEPSRTEVFATLTEEESPYEQAQYESLGGTGGGVSSFDLETFRNGQLETADDNPFGQNVIMLDDNSLVLQNNPLLEVGQSGSITSQSVSFAGRTYAYEEPSGFDFVQITEDPTNIFDIDYYYVDTAEGLLYKAERKEGANDVFTVRKIGSALERLNDKRVLLLSRKKMLAKFPSLAMNVDQQCVLGPDLGWEARFNHTFSNEIQKANRKAEKKDNWDRVLKGTTNAATWLKINVREKSLLDLDGIRNANLRDEILAYNDLLGEINYTLPETNSTIAQVEALLDEYDDESTENVRKQEILQRLARIDQGTSIPSTEEIDIMLSENERVEKAYQSLSEKSEECFQKIEERFEPGQRVWPDDWYLEVRLAQDQAELLYCPFEMLSGGWENTQRLEQLQIDDSDLTDQFLTQALRFRDQWNTDAIGPINNDTRTFLDSGVRGVDINYPFIQQWIRDIDTAGVISHRPQGGVEKEIIIHCSDFYRSSILDYLPVTSTL